MLAAKASGRCIFLSQVLYRVANLVGVSMTTMPERSEMPSDRDTELKVFISHRDSVCGECGEQLGSKAWITLAGEKGALCLACGDIAHLVVLPSRDAALTLRDRKHS